MNGPACRAPEQASGAKENLHKTNEAGEDAGVLFVNSDQIVAIATA
jgi:hypothetical protein